MFSMFYGKSLNCIYIQWADISYRSNQWFWCKVICLLQLDIRFNRNRFKRNQNCNRSHTTHPELKEKEKVCIPLLLTAVDIQIYNVNRLFLFSQAAKQKSKDCRLHVTSIRNHFVSHVFERIYGLTDRDNVYEVHTNNFSEIYWSAG